MARNARHVDVILEQANERMPNEPDPLRHLGQRDSRRLVYKKHPSLQLQEPVQTARLIQFMHSECKPDDSPRNQIASTATAILKVSANSYNSHLKPAVFFFLVEKWPTRQVDIY